MSPTARSRDKSTIQVIVRAAAILRALAATRDGLSLAGLAKRVGLPRSTVQRIVHALEAENLLIAAAPSGGVRLGPALLRLAAGVESGVRIIAKPILAELAQELGETACLSLLGRNQAIFLERVIGSRQFAIGGLGERFPLHSSAAGKAMLALLSDVEIVRRIGHSYPCSTEFTLGTFPLLQRNLREIRRNGVSFCVQEVELGMAAIAVALRDPNGRIMALTMPMSMTRFMEMKRDASVRLLEARKRLMAQLSP